MANASEIPVSIVLVHGGFVDGSGWDQVYNILKKDGYTVSVVQNPTSSLADDVAATNRVLDAHKGPVILVGHSYGGVVITEAGNHPKVAGLAYIAAFAPDKGESVGSLIKDPVPGAPVPPIEPPSPVSVVGFRVGSCSAAICFCFSTTWARCFWKSAVVGPTDCREQPDATSRAMDSPIASELEHLIAHPPAPLRARPRAAPGPARPWDPASSPARAPARRSGTWSPCPRP